MAGTLYNANNVTVGHAVLWLAPWLPTEPPTELVADNTPLFDVDAWETAGWFGPGATHEGYKIAVETSTTTITIEEQSTAVLEAIEGKTISIEAALAEDRLTTIQLSWGGSDIATTAATASDPGVERMNLSDELQYFVGALETKNFAGLARRFYIPKLSATGSGDTEFRRAADKRTYPVKLTSLCKPSEIEIIDIVAPATA